MSQEVNDILYPRQPSHHTLNPTLYRNLEVNFPGGVIIANEGEPMQTGATYVLAGKPNTQILHSGEYYRVNCPFCRDTRHRLWVNHMYGQLDAHGRIMRFVARCYNEDCLADRDNWESFDNAVFNFTNAHERNRQVFPLNLPQDFTDPYTLTKAELPGNVIPVSQLARAMPNHPAVAYLMQGRRYSIFELDHYEVGYCTAVTNQRYATALHRIIFPIRRSGELIGWQAREIPPEYGPPYSATGPKYWGLPGMKKKLMLYNHDKALGKQVLVVVEGATSCHRVGDCAVGLMGKTMSTQQYMMILNDWPNVPIVLMLDPDAKEEMQGILADFVNNNIVIVPVWLPEGYDPSDYDRITIWNTIRAKARDIGVILPY